MAFHLVTGEPGDGKTNLAITLIKAEAEKDPSNPRPVFYDGIEILDAVALPWEKIEGKKWFTAPAGAIVVIDEAQRHFRPRRRDDVPEHAAQMETGRHLGIDLWLVTQHPSFIDPHERKLINTHRYVRRKMGTGWKTVYTWKGTNDNPERSASWEKATDKAEVTDNVPAFSWYRSTELNTTRRKIPKKVAWMLALFLAVPVVVGYGGYRVWQRTQSGGVSSIGNLVPGQPGLVGPGGGAPGEYGKPKPLTPLEYSQQFQPRVSGLAYTAPVYDKVTEVSTAPYPAACVQSETSCKCYTQQATLFADVSLALCQQIVSNGFFVAWRQPMPQPGHQKVPERADAAQGRPEVQRIPLPPPAPRQAPIEVTTSGDDGPLMDRRGRLVPEEAPGTPRS